MTAPLTNRIGWGDLPQRLRNAFTDAMGAAVSAEQRQTGGFSPGLASRLTLADGRRVFLKAISADRDPHAPMLYRREAHVMEHLPKPAPAPRLRWTHDDGTWVALALDDIDGHAPAQPWTAEELDRVLAALAALADDLTPAPADALAITEDLAENFSSWRRLAARSATDGTGQLPTWAHENLGQLAELESHWARAAIGTTLAHTDLRADNILLTPPRLMIVDWPYAVTTTPWMDLLLFLPSVTASSNIDPEQIWRRYRHARAAPDDDVNAVLAAIAGDYLTQSLRPAPPTIPGLRAHQRAKGDAALRWLRTRISRE
ncbi:phosphotransferase [Spirillospora sp. NPDC047418]